MNQQRCDARQSVRATCEARAHMPSCGAWRSGVCTAVGVGQRCDEGWERWWCGGGGAGEHCSLQAAAARGRGEAEEARSAAARAAQDAEDLAAALQALESHAAHLEAELRVVRAEQLPAPASGRSAAEAPSHACPPAASPSMAPLCAVQPPCHAALQVRFSVVTFKMWLGSLRNRVQWGHQDCAGSTEVG